VDWFEHRDTGRIHKLIAEDRVNFVAPADYTADSVLDVIVRGVIGRIGVREEFGR
jgi:hypothetical protein